jgi:iron complex outermembrane receptor protein
VVPQQFQFTTNVPAIVEGVDFDGSFQITRRWNAGIAASYSDGHMQNGSEPCNAPITPGQFLALCTSNGSISSAPKWNANLRSEYSQPLTSTLDGYVRGLYTYYPKNDRASGEGSGFTADAYGLLNLYTGIRSADGAWDVQLFAKNLTNTNKALSYDQTSEKNPIANVNLNFGQSGYYRTSATALREFGITARYAFGSR